MPKSTCCRICVHLLEDSARCSMLGKCPIAFKYVGDLVYTYRYPCKQICTREICPFFEKIKVKI